MGTEPKETSERRAERLGELGFTRTPWREIRAGVRRLREHNLVDRYLQL